MCGEIESKFEAGYGPRELRTRFPDKIAVCWRPGIETKNNYVPFPHLNEGHAKETNLGGLAFPPPPPHLPGLFSPPPLPQLL